MRIRIRNPACEYRIYWTVTIRKMLTIYSENLFIIFIIFIKSLLRAIFDLRFLLPVRDLLVLFQLDFYKLFNAISATKSGIDKKMHRENFFLLFWILSIWDASNKGFSTINQHIIYHLLIFSIHFKIVRNFLKKGAQRIKTRIFEARDLKFQTILGEYEKHLWSSR